MALLLDIFSSGGFPQLKAQLTVKKICAHQRKNLRKSAGYAVRFENIQ
jgi:hypothetical protein